MGFQSSEIISKELFDINFKLYRFLHINFYLWWINIIIFDSVYIDMPKLEWAYKIKYFIKYCL